MTTVSKKPATKTLTRKAPAKAKIEKPEVKLVRIHHGVKHRITMVAPEALEQSWEAELHGHGGAKALDHLAIWNLPVDSFVVPCSFHAEMKELLFQYSSRTLGELMTNALMQQLNWILLVDLSKSHCPVYLQVTGDGVNEIDPVGSMSQYIRGSFGSTFALQMTENEYPGVFIQSTVVELMTSLDYKLFDPTGKANLGGYGPSRTFQRIEMSDAFSVSEINKFVKRRSVTLAKTDLTHDHNGKRTAYYDRAINAIPAPELVAEKRMHKDELIGWVIRIK